MKRGETRFWDKMSMHIAIGGMTSEQQFRNKESYAGDLGMPKAADIVITFVNASGFLF